jgi:arylsulfatase A-like enzyme
MKMTTILRGALLLVANLAASALVLAADSHPNFLFVFTDDQRWDAMGVVQREQGERARFPWLHTPNMDRLAAEGVRFRNAFVTLSLCAPSRAAFLTGRYNHVNGVANNHTAFPVENVTHATLLRAAGYVTGYIGKWHMGSQHGQRPGFDFSASFIGQGRYIDCPIEVDGVATPSKGWVDDVSTDYALDFIRKNQAKPWSLMVGFKAAHGPFDPPARAKDRFAAAEARPVANLEVPAIYLGEANTAKQKKAAPTAKRPANLGYFRCISAADDNLGRLLALLDELHLAENTVVIFASDNGYYLGEHGLGDKRTAYDESLRIPMIVRYPKLGPAAKGRTVDELVLNIDLAPTLLDFAGLSRPELMQGRSWQPLLEGKADGWRSAFLFEYFREGQFAAPTVFGVRTDAAKLIRYPGHDEWTEVFDLKADPYEIKNLASDPARKELRAQLEAEFDKQAKLVDFRIPDYADEKTGVTTAPKSAKRPNTFVLSYDFAKDDAPKGAVVAEGLNGRKARRFDGKAHIEVANSPALDPAGGPWTIEAVVKAEQPTGVILARGGSSQGYALHLDEGRPVFNATANDSTSSVSAKQSITGRWVHLAAVISADRHLLLYVDGELVARSELKEFIGKDPKDSMQIGADTGGQVTSYKASSGFVGLIQSVHLFSGERTAEQIQKDAAEK